MAMSKSFSKEEIKKTIEYLKTNRPDLPATKEQAIKILDKMQEVSESFVETVEKVAKKVKQSKKAS